MTKKQWETWKLENYNNIDALIHFAEKNAPQWIDEFIVYQEQIAPALIPILEENDWATIASYLGDIKSTPNEKYYGTNPFTGNLEKITWENYITTLEETLTYNDFFKS